MTHHWDEFSKSLAEESLPRRESLRRLGFLFAGAVLSPLGTAWARGTTDPCKAFCRCRKGREQNQCLAACRECNMDMSRLVGTCGDYYCCGSSTPCGNYCADLDKDPYNCGACGYVCDEAGPWEYGACVGGRCEYVCAEGAIFCDGACIPVLWDPHNCGACGNVCPGWAPYCDQGVCVCPSGATVCGGQCVELLSDEFNCGACGAVCPDSAPYCNQGECGACPPGLTLCGGECVDLENDQHNCGACGNDCGLNLFCGWGGCYPPWWE